MNAMPSLESSSLPAVAPGQVTLVGAGPGDPELLTLKAVKAIRGATLLLVDDLVNDQVLQHASPRARIVHVGKRGGRASAAQSFIDNLMAMAAREGEAVVRLKGGDPFVFGRGGEEIEHLQRLGIPVQVINGVTAGLAASTSIGVALTHRDRAHGVVFVTGHPKPSGEEVDWPALAATAHSAKLTLVIYMGIANAHAIQAGLLRGLPADTPVAIVRNATLPDQRHAVCPLEGLLDTLEVERLGSPAIIIVGDVLRGMVGLRQAQAAAVRHAA